MEEIIKTVVLKGFMSHLDSRLDFEEGLNVITGENDNGKSAVIQGLRWLLTGEPKGDSFITKLSNGHEASSTSILIETERGTVEKIRNTSGATRWCITGSTDSHKSDLPLEAKVILDISEKIKVADFVSEMNFSFQLDAPFLLSETGSVGSIILGRLADTEPVDMASKSFEKEVINAKREYNLISKDIEGLQGDLLSYNHLGIVEKELNNLKNKLWLLEETKEKITKLKELKSKFLLNQEILNKVRDKINKVFCIVRIGEGVNVLSVKINKNINYKNLDTNYRINKDSIKNLEHKIQKLKIPDTDFQNLSEKYKRYDNSQRLVAEYSKNLRAIEKVCYILMVLEELPNLKFLELKVQNCEKITSFRGKFLKVITEIENNSKYSVDITTKNLIEIFRKYWDLEKLQGNLSRLNTVILTEKTTKLTLDSSSKLIEKELRDLQKELKTCPLCGGDFKDESKM